MLYLSNAFSLGMLNKLDVLLDVYELSDEYAKARLEAGFISAIGHQSTADFISALLGIEVPANRIQVSLNIGDSVLVLQLQTRLPEGKILTQDEIKEIPYKWIQVDVLDPNILIQDNY